MASIGAGLHQCLQTSPVPGSNSFTEGVGVCLQDLRWLKDTTHPPSLSEDLLLQQAQATDRSICMNVASRKSPDKNKNWLIGDVTLLQQRVSEKTDEYSKFKAEDQ